MSGDAAARLTPLAGLRVLDLADEWGILTGNILADLGADVVAVEPPGGLTARRIGRFEHDSGRPEDSLFWAAYFVSLLQTGEESEDELGRIHDVLERFTRSKTKQQLLEGALARGLPLSPTFTVAEVLDSPQLAYRNFWTAAATGAARKHPGPFARFSESPLRLRREAPGIGEHNAEVSTVVGRSDKIRPVRAKNRPSSYISMLPFRRPLVGSSAFTMTWMPLRLTLSSV